MFIIEFHSSIEFFEYHNMATPLMTIAITMKMILSEMEIGSQCSNFVDDFEVIEECVESFPKDHPIQHAWFALEKSLYAAKGDLESVEEEMQDFLETARNLA